MRAILLSAVHLSVVRLGVACLGVACLGVGGSSLVLEEVMLFVVFGLVKKEMYFV